MNIHQDIFQRTINNDNFRQELLTGKFSQVVLMSVPVGEEIGEEVHHVDQILIFVQGSGKALLNGESFEVKANDLVFVPAGFQHNFINTGQQTLKLFTVYSPPEHEVGEVFKTKEEADEAEEKES